VLGRFASRVRRRVGAGPKALLGSSLLGRIRVRLARLIVHHRRPKIDGRRLAGSIRTAGRT
jgi:hypothetical protein